MKQKVINCIRCKSEIKYEGPYRTIKYCSKLCRWNVTSFDWNIDQGCSDILRLLKEEYEISTGRKAKMLLCFIQLAEDKIKSKQWPTLTRKVTQIAVADIKDYMKKLKRKYWYYY